MATRNISRKAVPKKAAKAPKKQLTFDSLDRLKMDLMGVSAAVSAVRQVLARRTNLDGDLALLLMRSASHPLESVLAELDAALYG